MLNILGKLIDLAWTYKKDVAGGIPYWHDRTLIGVAVGLLADLLARYAGLSLSGELQAAIITVCTGVGALLSPHTGMVSKKPDANVTRRLADIADHGAN